MKRIVVLSSTLLLVLTAQAGLYRWVDDAGNVHFSDKVPAAASQKGHAKLNKKTGTVTKKVDPESIQSEKETLALAEKEKQQREEIRRIKQEALDVIQKRDDYLLSTYENEDEIKRSFESKIKMIEGNTKILKAQNSILNKRVIKLEEKATNTTHEDMLKSIATKIVNINKTIEQYQQALTENNKQIIKLSENYKTDLERFIELTQ
jgi:hypothetical protein